eukprot:2152985-Prymnesium_polylepis.1
MAEGGGVDDRHVFVDDRQLALVEEAAEDDWGDLALLLRAKQAADVASAEGALGSRAVDAQRAAVGGAGPRLPAAPHAVDRELRHVSVASGQHARPRR